MGKIPEETIERANSVPIEAILAEQGIGIRRQGHLLRARCPFPDHEDPNPSFTIYPHDNSWYCFGCKRGGDAIALVRQLYGMSFREAVEYLTGLDLSSIPIPPPPKVVKADESQCLLSSEELKRAVDIAAECYHHRLLKYPPALQYLLKRGFDLEDVKRFKIGWGEGLARWLVEHSLPAEDAALIRKARLVSDKGDFFRGWITFPTPDGSYMVGRILGSGEPKYLGMPGLPKPVWGIEAIEGPIVFLCEGIPDALTLIKWGYPAAALLGSHASRRQVEALRRFHLLIVVFDNDEAGRLGVEELIEAKLPVRAVTLPSNVKDVNELARHPDGREIFKKLVGV